MHLQVVLQGDKRSYKRRSSSESILDNGADQHQRLLYRITARHTGAKSLQNDKELCPHVFTAPGEELPHYGQPGEYAQGHTDNNPYLDGINEQP